MRDVRRVAGFALVALLSSACGKSGEGAETPKPAPAAESGASAADSEPAAPEPAAPQEPGPTVSFDEIVYHFQDASVPPPDHRSVTITVKGGAIVRVVDSYGDEVERQEGVLNPTGLAKLNQAFADAGIRPKPRDPNVAVTACSGGTSETLTLREGGNEVFVGRIEHCGPAHTPDFVGDLEPFIAALKALASSGPTEN